MRIVQEPAIRVICNCGNNRRHPSSGLRAFRTGVRTIDTCAISEDGVHGRPRTPPGPGVTAIAEREATSAAVNDRGWVRRRARHRAGRGSRAGCRVPGSRRPPVPCRSMRQRPEIPRSQIAALVVPLHADSAGAGPGIRATRSSARMDAFRIRSVYVRGSASIALSGAGGTFLDEPWALSYLSGGMRWIRPREGGAVRPVAVW